MTIRSGFYNSVNSDRKYYADDMNMPYKKIVTDGVIPNPTSALQVIANGGMSVKINAGNGIFAGRWLENDSDVVITLDAAHATLGRIDLIVLRVDETESVRATTAVVIKGTPASTPVAPEYQRTDTIHDYVLAQVEINALTAIISQSNITDTRANTAMCGWCINLIESIDTETLWLQWKTAGEEAAASNQAAFDAWFQNVKETLSTATLIRQYVNRYNAESDGITTVPIGISQYNANLDILEVYINGFNAIPTVDYTVNGSTSITLVNAVNAGSYVVFKVFKSIDGSDAETVVSQVVALQNKINAIEENIYYCNGYNDNEGLKAFIDEWLLTSPTKDKIEVVGKFVNNSSVTTASDGKSYNFVCESTDRGLVLDFSKCEIINAEDNFMYLKNVEAVNCSVKFNRSSAVIGFAGNNAKYTGCEVIGVINGTTSYGFKGDALDIKACDVNLTNSGIIYGMDVTNALIDGCKVYVKSTGGSAYAVSLATESRAVNCDFEGETAATDTTTSGNGGIGGGYFSNCKFIGSGGLKGHGFYVRAGYLLDATNCIFRGYTAASSGGYGAGLAAANDSGNTYLLNGINCNQVTKTGFTQTNSMDLPGGYGVVSGCLYAAATANTNIATLAAYNRNRV